MLVYATLDPGLNTRATIISIMIKKFNKINNLEAVSIKAVNLY